MARRVYDIFLEANARRSLHFGHPVWAKGHHAATGIRAPARAPYAKRLDGRVVVRLRPAQRFVRRVDRAAASRVRTAWRTGLQLPGRRSAGLGDTRTRTRRRVLRRARQCAPGRDDDDAFARSDSAAIRIAAGTLQRSANWPSIPSGRIAASAVRCSRSRNGGPPRATHLALDAPYAAVRLIDFYRREGFQPVDVMRFPGHNYDSTILCKAVSVGSGRIVAGDTAQFDVTRHVGAAS